MSRPRNPILTREPIIRETLNLIEASGVPDSTLVQLAGLNHRYLGQLREGRVANPGILCISWLLEAIGYELVIRKRETPDAL